MILIISFLSLFETTKGVKPLTAPFPLIFISNLFISFETKLLANPGKLSLAKEIATIFSAFSPNLRNQKPKDPPDFRYLNFTKFYIC